MRELLKARDQRELGQLQQRYRRVDLLLCDELGFVPFDRAGGELLFNLLADRCERRSTMLSTNLAFSERVHVFRDEKLTTAWLDRLSHHAEILTTRGDSYRRRQRRRRAKKPRRAESFRRAFENRLARRSRLGPTSGSRVGPK